MNPSTNFVVAPTFVRMGRPRINAAEGEKTTARFREGTMDRIKAALGKKEAMSDFIREAVERELQRRKNDGR